jgi:hypothetical protein
MRVAFDDLGDVRLAIIQFDDVVDEHKARVRDRGGSRRVADTSLDRNPTLH